MNYRLADILAEKSLNTTATEVIPINIQDPISRIDILWKPTLWDDAMAAALPAGITKIELVDGSDVLHSLNGRENQALCLYDRRLPTMNSPRLISGNISHCMMGIDFGRYLFDPELAFDPTKFRNPQLKITHDCTAVGALTTVHSLTIKAHIFDEKAISPIGFLTANEHFVWTPSAADKYEYVNLPLDRVIRQILLRGHLDATDPTNVVDYFKLSEDNDKRIPFDVELSDYCHMMRGVWQQIIEGVTEYASYTPGHFYKYVTPTDEFTQPLMMGNTTGVYVWATAATKGGLMQRMASDTMGCSGMVFGYLPHHCIQFPFGDQKDINDWYDVTRLGSLRARMMSGDDCSTTSVISLVLQQLRRY